MAKDIAWLVAVSAGGGAVPPFVSSQILGTSSAAMDARSTRESTPRSPRYRRAGRDGIYKILGLGQEIGVCIGRGSHKAQFESMADLVQTNAVCSKGLDVAAIRKNNQSCYVCTALVGPSRSP